MSTLTINTPRWALPLIDTTKRYLGAKGGRGSGKSHFFAEMLVEQAIDKPVNIACFRENQRSLAQSAKKLIETKIESLAVGHLFEVQRDRIIGKNGSLFQFHGLRDHTADSIKSLEGIDKAWLEEAQNISQRSFEILRPTIRKPMSQIWCSWNPRNHDDPVELLPWNSENSTCVRVNYYDNPWFPEVLRQEMEYDRSRDIDRYNHIWLGDFETFSESRVFKNWRVEEFDTPIDSIFKLGADFGYAIDPTVLIRCFLSGQKLFIDYEAYQHQCEIVNMNILFNTIPESNKYPIVADSSRPETISHLKNNGFPRIYPSAKGSGSVEDGIEWLKSFEIIVHPRCEKTISELTNYSYIVDPDTGKITRKLRDAHNHVIDALRYACEGARKLSESEKKQAPAAPAAPAKNYW